MPITPKSSRRAAPKRLLPPIHPGEILQDFVTEFELSSARQLAAHLKVTTNRVTGILNGQRAITADTALRLAKLFGTSAAFWMNLQNLYELELATRAADKTLRSIAPL